MASAVDTRPNQFQEKLYAPLRFLRVVVNIPAVGVDGSPAINAPPIVPPTLPERPPELGEGLAALGSFDFEKNAVRDIVRDLTEARVRSEAAAAAAAEAAEKRSRERDAAAAERQRREEEAAAAARERRERSEAATAAAAADEQAANEAMERRTRDLSVAETAEQQRQSWGRNSFPYGRESSTSDADPQGWTSTSAPVVRAVSSGGSKPSTWTCSACTLENDVANMDVCGLCGTPGPGAAVAASHVRQQAQHATPPPRPQLLPPASTLLQSQQQPQQPPLQFHGARGAQLQIPSLAQQQQHQQQQWQPQPTQQQPQLWPQPPQRAAMPDGSGRYSTGGGGSQPFAMWTCPLCSTQSAAGARLCRLCGTANPSVSL